MDYSRPTLADRLAADYVAGALRGPARRRLEALLPAHPVLRAAVRDWQDRLAPLTGAIDPVEPPARVWSRIEARLGGTPAAAPAAAAAPRWWQRLGLWQGLSGLAVAGLAAVLVLGSAPPPPAGAPIVVVLSPVAPPPGAAGGIVPASFVAGINRDGSAMVMRPVSAVELQADRALELWAVPAAGAPRSLGVISASSPTVVQRGKVLDDTVAFAVSLEPPGGSPTGVATGPVLFLGKIGS
jgi:anti-sigma-K factor RskA